MEVVLRMRTVEISDTERVFDLERLSNTESEKLKKLMDANNLQSYEALVEAIKADRIGFGDFNDVGFEFPCEPCSSGIDFFPEGWIEFRGENKEAA